MLLFLTIRCFINYIEPEVIKMKKTIYILLATFILWSLAFAADAMNTNTTINWYGQGSLLHNQELSDNQLDDGDNDLQRKRRHRRRRKIRPPQKGW